jgi:segregation and condensation protein B
VNADYPVQELKKIVEALLFASESPMSDSQIQAIFSELEAPRKQEIQAAIDEICLDYQNSAIELHQVASGWRFQVKAEQASWVARLFTQKPPKYSSALLETIAIIAYQQPVTRGDIEEIRGVSVSTYMIDTLLDREWVKVDGHKEVPGRPALYVTTKQFLDYFNLASLEDMPALQELEALTTVGEMAI